MMGCVCVWLRSRLLTETRVVQQGYLYYYTFSLHILYQHHSQRTEANHAGNLGYDLGELDGAHQRLHGVRLQRQPHELHGGADVHTAGCVFQPRSVQHE